MLIAIQQVIEFLYVCGIPSAILMLFNYVRTNYVKQKEEEKVIRLALQAILRDRLTQSYLRMKSNGYCTLTDKNNWENMYEQYHALAVNGVMDSIREEVLEFPIEKGYEQMDIEMIIALINNVGFPIVVAAALAYYIYKDWNRDKTQLDKILRKTNQILEILKNDSNNS